MTASKTIKRKRPGGNPGGKNESTEAEEISVPDIQESVKGLKASIEVAENIIERLEHDTGRGGICGCG